MLCSRCWSRWRIDSGRLYGTAFFRIVDLPAVRRARRGRDADVGLHVRRHGSAWSANINDALRRRRCPTRSRPTWMLASIGNIVTWEFVGYNMLIFYSALRVVPTIALRGGRDRRRRASSASSRASSCRRSAARSSSRRSSRSSAASSCSTSRTSCDAGAQRDHHVLHARTCTPTTLSFSGQQYNYSATVAIVMGVITMVIAYVVQLRGIAEGGADDDATAPAEPAAPKRGAAPPRRPHVAGSPRRSRRC